MYKTCTQFVKVEIEQPCGKEDCMWVSGCVEYEVSVTRDFGHYGGRSDDYPGDPDEITIEKVVSYELWITDTPDKDEGTVEEHVVVVEPEIKEVETNNPNVVEEVVKSPIQVPRSQNNLKKRKKKKHRR